MKSKVPSPQPVWVASQPLPSLFNCSNDMALAAHVRQYVPPKRIRQMEADLADLARVWEGTRFAGPWGWSLATKRRYERMGVPVEALPSDEWLEEVRRLSSRQFGCCYLKRLLRTLNDLNMLGWQMVWMERAPQLCEFEWGKPAVIPRIYKSPWSSSGRGVFVTNKYDERTQRRLEGFVSSQGGYVVDWFFDDKVLDFAMEFFVHEDHRVEFLGYSVFCAEKNGSYHYNYVESQEALLRRIDADEGLLQWLIAYHKEHLARLAYHGPVGIDMLKTADGSIHPCLEMNLRMNMGILALLLHERYGDRATAALTPPRGHGFQAVLDQGHLRIDFRP